MALSTKVGAYTIGHWFNVATITNVVSATATYGIGISQTFVDKDGTVISGNYYMNVLNPSNNQVERIYVPASGVSADGLTIGIQTTGEVTRGLKPTGYNSTDGSSTYSFKFKPGYIVSASVDPIILTEFQKAFLGLIATGGLDFIIGDGTNSTVTIKHFKSGSTIGWLRKNDSTAKVQFSNDGTTWVNMDNAGVGVLTAGRYVNAAQLALGIVQIDNNYALTTGSANAYVATISSTTAIYTDGEEISIEANFTNTGTATIAVNGGAAKDIKDSSGNALVGGEIISGYRYKLSYNGTYYKLLTKTIPSQNTKSLVAGENFAQGELAYVESDGKAWKTKRTAPAFATLAGSTSVGTWMNVLKLSDNKVVTLYDRTGIAGVVSTISQTTATSGSITTIVAANSRQVRATVIGTDKFAVAYESTSDNKVYGVVCTVSGTTITVGTPVKLYDTETVNQNTIDICKLDTDKFVVTFVNLTSDDPIAIASSVSGTTITAGATYQIEATTAVGATMCSQMATDSIIAFWDDGTNVSCKFINYSGTTVSGASGITDLYAGSLDIGQGATGVIVVDAKNILLYKQFTGAGMRVSRITSFEGEYTTAPQYNSTSDTYLQIGATGNARLINHDNTIMSLIYVDANSDPHIRQYQVSNNSFEEIYTSGAISAETINTGGINGVAFESNKNRLFIAIGTSTPAVKYSVFIDTSNEFIGVASSAITAPAGGSFISHGDATTSGLTAGTGYFVGDAGAVATTGIRRIGVATTTTNLYVS